MTGPLVRWPMIKGGCFTPGLLSLWKRRIGKSVS